MGDEATEAQIERIQSEDVMSFKNISMMIGGQPSWLFYCCDLSIDCQAGQPK